MKADFEKGTKVCSECKRELPIEMFHKNKSKSDGLQSYCKQCCSDYDRSNRRSTFQGELKKSKKGCSSILIRDYELTKKQLNRREYYRKYHNGSITDPHGILVWYDEKLNELDGEIYEKARAREYGIQKCCAVRGYVGRVKPSEHFLFDFDLEQMLKDNVYIGSGKYKYYMTKWWDGEIRHWTVNDGIWKK